MGLSRKHKKDLKRLRKNAEAVWSEQQEVLAHAAAVLEKSRRHATKYAKKEVVPLVKDTYQSRVRPVYDNGVSAVEGTYSSARDAYKHKVLPTFAAVGGTAAAAFEAAKDSKNRAKLAEISKARWEELTTPRRRRTRPAPSSPSAPRSSRWVASATPSGRRSVPTTSCGSPRTSRPAPRSPRRRPRPDRRTPGRISHSEVRLFRLSGTSSHRG